MKIFNLLLISGLTLGSLGCSWTRFDEMADQSPATRVTPRGDINSGSFGDAILGLLSPTNDDGGKFLVAGNGNPSLQSVTVSPSGAISSGCTSANEIQTKLNATQRINALASAPPDTTATFGEDPPFAYVSLLSKGQGLVKLIETTHYHQIGNEIPAPSEVSKFGLALATGNFDGQGNSDDLAVAGSGAVVVWPTNQSAKWPTLDDTHRLLINQAAAADWPTGDIEVMAAGNVDPTNAEDEIVAAAPKTNTVVIAYGLRTCFEGSTNTCGKVLKIPQPDGANEFGGALLVADVDDDGNKELVIGSPNNGAVYIYDLGAANFAETPEPLGQPIKLTSADTSGFGSSLAWGKFTGTVDKYLAVGAPSTKVGEAADAGKIVLFDRNLQQANEKGVTITNAESSTLLGRKLGLFKYKRGENEFDTLVAAGRDEIFVFFANLLNNHTDFRQR